MGVDQSVHPFFVTFTFFVIYRFRMGYSLSFPFNIALFPLVSRLAPVFSKVEPYAVCRLSLNGYFVG